MKPKYFVFIIIIIIAQSSVSQSLITYDSLANIAKSKIANNTFDYKNRKTWFEKFDTQSQSKNYIITLLDFMESSKLSQQDELIIIEYIGKLYSINGEYAESEALQEKAYERGLISVNLLSNLGANENYLGKNQEALQHYLESIDLSKKTKAKISEIICDLNIGKLYADLGINNKSREYFRIASNNAHSIKDTFYYATALKNLGIQYLNLPNIDSALYYFTSAKNLLTKDDQQILKMQCIHHIGICYSELGDHQKALELYKIVENFYKEGNHERELANVYYDYSYSYIEMGDFDKAIDYAKRNHTIYVNLKDIISQQSASKQLAEIYKKKGDYKNALLYHEQFFQLYDSIRKTKNIEEVTELRLNHKFESEKAITKALYQSKIERQSFIQNTLIFGMIAISLLMYFWYWAYKVIKKSKETITSQHAQLQILNNANENLIYSLSHDIKEPLLGVLLLLQKLKIEDPFLSQASAALENQVNAVNIIVNNLLQNKINNNGPDSNCNLQEINETIDSVIKSLNYSIKEKNITINNKLQDQIQDITLKISKQKLYLILLNVISNSIKHSDDFQSIDIFSENNSILLRDYGKGIAKDILARIADNKMVPQTDKAVSGSTGLGLYLIKNLLQDTDVKMTIQNADGRGTIVAIG